MQFRERTAKDKAALYDCASCKGEKHGCLLDKVEITVCAPELSGQSFIVNKDNWPILSQAWAARVGHDKTPDWAVLASFNLCPVPLFSLFSIEAYNLYCTLGGVGACASPADYYELPAIWIRACRTISAEINRLAQYEKT